MIAYLAGLVGILLGAHTAQKRGGNQADMAQYAVGFGLAFFLSASLILYLIQALL